MVAAVIPVKGRHSLLKQTISRLLNKNKLGVVLCVGDADEREVCKSYGAEFVEHANHPLGAKWNHGFKALQRYNPSSVLFVGSSDWVSDNFTQTLEPYLDEYGLVGKAGCHFLDISRNGNRLVYWPGYAAAGETSEDHKLRKDEPIGGGRMISARVLDKIGWQPFDSHKNNSLDWAMYNKTLNVGEKVGLITDDVHIMAISTDRWNNKHVFEDHWRGKLPSERIKNPDNFLNLYFPEAYSV